MRTGTFPSEAGSCAQARRQVQVNQASFSTRLASLKMKGTYFSSSVSHALCAKGQILLVTRVNASLIFNQYRSELFAFIVRCFNFSDRTALVIHLIIFGGKSMEGGHKTKPISKLQVKKLHPAALLPKKGSPLAAGYDLCANEDAVVPKGGKAKISTGLSWACPPNTYARVAPRSGLAWKNSISVGAGVIDEDYRGEVCVILFNHGTEDFIVKKHDRIAQVIIEKIEPTEIEEVAELADTQRGEGGFGSTGVASHPV